MKRPSPKGKKSPSSPKTLTEIKLLAKPSFAVLKSHHLPLSVEKGQMAKNASMKLQNEGETGGTHICVISGSNPGMIFILRLLLIL